MENFGRTFKNCSNLLHFSKCIRIVRSGNYLLSKNKECSSFAAVLSSHVRPVSCMHTSSSVKDGACMKTDSKSQPAPKQRSLPDGPDLKHFISKLPEGIVESAAERDVPDDSPIPYLGKNDVRGENRKVYFETYGCQMNENDTDIAWSILQASGYQRTTSIKESDIILVVTCAIREGAEQKIWKRLEYFKSLKKSRPRHTSLPPLKIGILGCMAERLKSRIVEKEKSVDVVCGPDAYKDLPRLLSLTESGQAAVNVLLSFDETYADVVPVRLNSNSPSAFVSIMRGCDNMCSYCIVPFTRGRERSRPMDSILDELRQLSDQGVKEVMLLGQNVNSYRDTSTVTVHTATPDPSPPMSKGFRTVYKPRTGGQRFSDLLDQASLINPEMRIRFTSPHPKDFPDEVLYLIRERPNICNQIHLPAQSGSNSVLERMRRGYTIESYMDLVHHIREIVPDVCLSSDFIAGFCGETEEDHERTIKLLREVKYQFAFCFPYSLRQKTHAHHRLEDDVPQNVKVRRHQELVTVFREEAERLNHALIGRQQIVLIEGTSKRSENAMYGKNDGNTKVIIPAAEIPVSRSSTTFRKMEPGDYVLVQVNEATSQVLKGTALYHSSLGEFFRQKSSPKTEASPGTAAAPAPAGNGDLCYLQPEFN